MIASGIYLQELCDHDKLEPMKRYVDPRKAPRPVFRYTLLAVLMMVCVHVFVLRGMPVYSPAIDTVSVPPHSEIQDFESAEAIVKDGQLQDDKWLEGILASLPQPDPIMNKNVPTDPANVPENTQAAIPQDIIRAPAARSAPRVKMIPPVRDGGGARIVIIIDDMGMNYSNTKAVMQLPGPLTLAFLPYAPHVDTLAQEALAQGHELMIHTPMEPMNGDLDVGPLALLKGMNDADFDNSLNKIFQSFDGYVGINNHMGSRLTQDEAAMNRVMDALKARDLFFVDSKTISTSIAAKVAAAHGLPYAERDVFLDHEDTPEFVMNALHRLERVAQERGYAIAIGHPKDNTIAGLKGWLAGLEARGFRLVPVSEVLTRPQAGGGPAVSAAITKQAAETMPEIEPAAEEAPVIEEAHDPVSDLLDYPTDFNSYAPDPQPSAPPE